MDLDVLVECYKALADKTRLRILSLLRIEELCVYELVDILQMSQPSVSQHLRRMKSAKLVKERRDGQWVYYSLDGALFPFFEANLETLPDMSEEIKRMRGLNSCCEAEYVEISS